MRSSDIVKTFKKFPNKGVIEIRQINNLIVLSTCNEDHGLYNCERYIKQMNGTLEKEDNFPKTANVMYDSQGNVIRILFYEGYWMHDMLAIMEFKYNENNDMIEEIVIGRNLGVISDSYYEYDHLRRIIRRINHSIDHPEYDTESRYVTTYSYIGEDDTVRYINESKYDDPTTYSNQIWFDKDGIMLYSNKVDKNEGIILSSKYKYNKKKDRYRCKTTKIEFI